MQHIRADFVFGGGKEHKFWECDNCGLVYLWPVPSEEDEARFYAEEFEKYMSKRSSAGQEWLGAEKHAKANEENVVRRMKVLKDDVKPGMDILEIGCSSGFMMEAFNKAGLNPVGIEPSKLFLLYLKEKGYKAYESVKELKKNIEKKEFDRIVHFFVLEHIRDTEGFIREQLELLKQNGKIIAEVPCVNDPLTSLYRIPAFERFYWSIAHHYYFNPRSLGYILDKIGCKYKFFAEQRYDLSNHLVWMQTGKPGGQGKYNNIFSRKTIDSYSWDLKQKWLCDTFFVQIEKQ